MAVHEIIPSSNVLAVDIRDTLGESTNALERLCTSPNINMFSLKKPVHLNRLGYFPALNSDWYKGEFFDYGIEVTQITLDQAETVHWRYDRPKGGANSAYRLADFVGYYHKAPKMTVMEIPQEVYSNGENVSLFTTFRRSTSTAIGYDLLFPNQNRYLCMMIKKGSQYKVRTATNPIGHPSGDYDYVTLTKDAIGWLGVGTHKAISFLSNEQISDWTSAPASRLLYYAGYADALDSNVKNFIVKTFIPTPDYSWVFSPSEIEYALTNERFTIVITALKPIDMSTYQIKGTYTTSSGAVKSVTLKSLIPTIEDNLILQQGQSRTLNFTATIWTDSNGAGIRPPSTDERFTFMINLTAPAKDGIGEVTFANGSCECYSRSKF